MPVEIKTERPDTPTIGGPPINDSTPTTSGQHKDALLSDLRNIRLKYAQSVFQLKTFENEKKQLQNENQSLKT